MSVAESEVSVLKTPEWLEILENKRKRVHKLAHEVGAGAPCLVCKEQCKGLNLHFWRKLCIECKCRKEDHEVEEEEIGYAQFEILFGSKKVKKTTLKFDSQTKSFDWIPPNVPQELVVDYLKSIPLSKLPISNSEGARYRKQQLEKQIPLHDIDPNACHSLSFQETEEFKKYLSNLKNEVIGQGRIMKYQSPQKIKETYVFDSFPNVVASSEELKVQKLHTAEIRCHETQNSTHQNELLKCDSSFKNSQHFSNSLMMAGKFPFEEKQEIKSGKEKENMLKSNESYPEEQHNYSYKSGKKPEIIRTVGNEIHKFNNENRDFKEDGSTNYPNPCDVVICKDLLNKFEGLKTSSMDIPFVPVQEANLIMSNKNQSNRGLEKYLPEAEEKSDSPEHFPAPPETCQQCLSILNPEEVVVKTDHGGNSVLWHASCFVCETCKELLVDLMYFFHEGKVFCGRHYADIMKIPRCYACDELIFVKEYTCAEGESYHVKHFCCFHCDQPLAGKQYISKDSNPICLDCYETIFGKKCQTCSLLISAKEKRISWKNLDFHVSPDCFRCTGCKNSLLEKKFVVKNNHVFCNKDCFILFSQ